VAVRRPEFTDQARAQIQPPLPPTGRPVAVGRPRAGTQRDSVQRWL